MKVEELASLINSDFYAGVPDSQLRALCDYLMNTYGIDPKHHIIAPNEGNATALAAGYYLATGKTGVVYMQNSGEGNAINPIASLCNDEVYGIPVVFIIGWRGEPGVHDEPQHVYQGEVTLKLLDVMDVAYFVIDKDTTVDGVKAKLDEWKALLSAGKQVAFVIRKGALSHDKKIEYTNNWTMTREEAIKRIVAVTKDDPIVSTTGKASRELFEIRETNGEGHGCDFLTVGSMGHSSSIAFEIAVQKPEKKVWCIDGDGALLMHMGSMAMIGCNMLNNFVHVVINNGAHDTVGGMPTVDAGRKLSVVAREMGYQYVVGVSTLEELDKVLAEAKMRHELCFIEVFCSTGAREDLGRPTTTTKENRNSFMRHLD